MLYCLAAVILACCDESVSVGRPVRPSHSFQMALEEHDALAGAQVPDPAEAVQPARDTQRPVRLASHAVDLLAVAFLVQHLRQLLQVPQTPAVVPHRGRQEPCAVC